MECQLCHNRIGLLRRLVDRGFCCAEHRRRMPAFSAKLARELSWSDDSWPESPSYGGQRYTKAAPPTHAGPAVAGFLALLLLALVFAGLPSSSSSPRIRGSAPSLGVGEALSNIIRNWSSLRLTEDFKSGLADWVPARSAAEGWTYSGGFIRPGSLRFWKKSMSLADYNFEFQGQIEKNGLGWVYRAKDPKNYYATKIVISRPGPLPGAEIVRYAILDGKEWNRVRLPLPVQIRTGIGYKVEVAVNGGRFSTLVNGRMVDTWSDQHLKFGGVGFFADPGETATIRYAFISDRTTRLGRLFSSLQTGYAVPHVPF